MMIIIAMLINDVQLMSSSLSYAIIIRVSTTKTSFILVDMIWIDTCIMQKKPGRPSNGKIGW